MPTASSPCVTADIYSLDKEAFKALQTDCDHSTQDNNELELVPRAATARDEFLDQAVEKAINSAVKVKNTDSACMDWSPTSPLTWPKAISRVMRCTNMQATTQRISDDSSYDSDAEIVGHQLVSSLPTSTHNHVLIYNPGAEL